MAPKEEISSKTYPESVEASPKDGEDGASENDVMREFTVDQWCGVGRGCHLFRSFLFSLIMISTNVIQTKNF